MIIILRARDDSDGGVGEAGRELHKQLQERGKHTSILALVHLGISTIMFKMVCCSLAYKGMSWNGEIGTPSFSR